ncbi:methyl-accepting chemotaxis protein [Celeribacter neptunius]|uniref:Methyl-accepting chemotaxis protein n=1 Tax=Celeribacter neptunius TaxID=588602 RepID=A0A1I3IJA6_9RHOB|nr:methyl-accepting chemotaxis protein [Celeribacter neptunius]SFI48095.1 methyl-accepting chemotaxis protein [Celeribacter neptunius]
MAVTLSRLNDILKAALSRPTDAASRDALGLLAKICLPLGAILIAVVAAAGGNMTLALTGGPAMMVLGFLAPRLPGRLAAIMVGQALVGLAIVLNAALAGTPLHLDTNMLFFAMLAGIVIMSDFSALLWAVMTITLHHVLLLALAPTLVFPPADFTSNLIRLGFHSGISLLEFLALGYMLARRHELSIVATNRTQEAEFLAEEAQKALEQIEAEQARAELALEEARAASASAEEAQQTAETALRDSEEARAEREALRKQEDAARSTRDQALQTLLDVFEHHLEELAAGNLATRITEDLDKAYLGLRDSFNVSVERLGATIQEVREQSTEMQSLSREIAASADDLSVRTERQAATLADVARTVNDLTGALETVATESTDARSLAETTSKDAEDGSSIMQDAVAAMDAIEKSSQEINKITTVIDDIAFQTNLLALNAGVEAARAGEAGRGFAVVASEVRALAQRSSDAAREINQLILRSTQQVKSGADLVNRTGHALGGIKTSVDTITHRLKSSADATQAQSQDLAKVNHSISELESVTQQNAAMFEQTTAANTQLSDGARTLSELVQTFVTVAGTAQAGESDWSQPPAMALRNAG